MKCIPGLVLLLCIVSLSLSEEIGLTSDNEVIAEVAVVCSKEVADWGNHDRKKILFYLTRIFWDISARFKTLRKSNISFRVVSVILINSAEEQPFIENAREEDGSINTSKSLQLFSEWISKKINTFPKIDIALAIIRGRASHTSHAYIGTSCENTGEAYSGVGLALWNYWGSVQVHASHSLGSLFGAENLEDLADCADGAYAMDIRQHVGLRQFFSPCNDQLIHDFIVSDRAACLRKINDLSTPPVLDTDFDHATMPHSIQEYCRHIHFGNEAGVIAREDINNCKNVRCRWWKSEYEVELSPLDTTKCGHNRQCFRGTCLEPGSLLVNIGSGKCVRGKSRFDENDSVVLSECPRASIPTDRFVLLHSVTNSANDNLIATYFMSSRDKEIKEKCLRSSQGGDVGFVSCEFMSSLLIWEVLELENGEVLLKHYATGKCAKDHNGIIITDSDCDEKLPTFRWKFHLAYPLPGMCGEDEMCESDLRLHASLRLEPMDIVNRDSTLILDITMLNFGEPAIAPAITVSWNASLKLDPIPNKCAFMYHIENNITSYKCKLGRLLAHKEKAKFVPLHLNLTDGLVNGTELKTRFVMNMVASTASYMTREESVEKTFSMYSDIYIEGSHTSLTIKAKEQTVAIHPNFKIRLKGSIQLPNITAVLKIPSRVHTSKDSTITLNAREDFMDKDNTNFTTNCFPVNFYLGMAQPNQDFDECLMTPTRIMAENFLQHSVKNSRFKNPSSDLRVNEQGELEISCNSSQVACLEVICHFDYFVPGGVAVIPLLLEIQTNELEMLKKIYDAKSVKVESLGRLILPEAVKFLQPESHMSDETVSVIKLTYKENLPKTDEIAIAVFVGILAILGIYAWYMRKGVSALNSTRSEEGIVSRNEECENRLNGKSSQSVTSPNISSTFNNSKDSMTSKKRMPRFNPELSEIKE